MQLADFQKSSVLAVDDTPDNLQLISQALHGACRLKVATHGEKALSITRSYPPPDLILLDIQMPGLSGFDVIRELKADPITRNIPVIFVTGADDSASEIEGFELGAVDYITKPFNPHIIRARVFTQLALRQAQQRIEQQNTSLQAEKELVEGIVNRMLHARQFDTRHLRYLVAPMEHTNGDVLLSTFTPDGRQWLLVGDMTGHGLPAAMAAPLVSYVFYRLAAANEQADRLLGEISKVLYEQLPLSLYMAGTLVEVAPERCQVKVWNAGLPASLLRLSGTEIKAIDSDGVPLGITSDTRLLPQAQQFTLGAAAHLYLFSDGVTEIENPAGEGMEIEGIEAFLHQFDPASHELETLLDHLKAFRQSDDFQDDVTFVELSLGAY